MQPSEEIRALAGMLHGDPTAGSLPSERQHELLLMGVVVSLEEIAASSPPNGSHSDQQVDNPAQEVVQILQAAAAANASSGVRLQAYQALLRLAQGSLPLAVDAIYRLAVEENLLAARQAIITNHWQPANAGLRALFDWFLHLEAGKPFPEESLPVLTQAYFSEASPLLQRRLLSTAVQNRAENWARIINAVQSSGPAVLAELVDRYPQYRPTERQIAIEQLTHLASRGSPAARDALAQLFLRYEDSQARGIILEQDYLPDDAHGRALIFFLAEDWQRYNTLDFDHSLLVDAYEQAGRSLRRRLLEHSRHTGQMDWLRGLSGVPVPESEVRWLNDLTDADWELAIRRLTENDKPGEMWRLAQVAPPIWSATILARLEKRGWLPEAAEESTSFANLSQLAAGVLAKPLDVRPVKALYAPINEITCLAMHPNGASLAAGSSDQRVFLWSLPDGTLQEPPIMGPAPVTRAMAFNPDGSLLVCAGGDNRIRVFRPTNGQLVKTFEGHRAMIRSLVVHPDGRTLYSAGFDGSVRFWRFPYGAELKTLRPEPGEIFSMALGAHGTHLLSGGADSLVSVWTLPDGVTARVLAGHAATVTHLAASPDSELVASAGRDGMIRLWNFTSGGLIRTIPITTPLTAMIMHPNEQVLIGGSSSGAITLWNLSTGRVIEQLNAHRQPITGLALSPEGDRLYSADASASLASLQVWNLQLFLSIRLVGEVSRPGAASALQQRLDDPHLTPAERQWLAFSSELARWRQRFDIELAEPGIIQIGDFDIELA